MFSLIYTNLKTHICADCSWSVKSIETINIQTYKNMLIKQEHNFPVSLGLGWGEVGEELGFVFCFCLGFLAKAMF